MARHRGVRNRQFSYDEEEGDFYDEDEEARACEEHRQQMLEARGEGDTSAAANNAESRRSSGGGISLSSYFDVPGTTSRQQQQQQSRQQTHRAGRDPEGSADRHPPDRPDTGSHSAGGAAADADLVAAVAAELESRVGKGRFSPDQLRRAIITSGYEVDTAQAILLTSSDGEIQFQSTGADDSASAGLPPPPGLGTNNSPSSLAFGLCVDGREEWKRKSVVSISGTTIPDTSKPASNTVSATAPSVKPFGFDTPSPDDINMSRQAGARGGGISGGGGTSPKAKVLHISGSTPTVATRKSVPAITTPSSGRGPSSGKSPTAIAASKISPRSGGQSPTKVGSTAALRSGAARLESASDEEEGGGKERLAMVVIGHVDAGKSTLMGQVLVQMGRVSQRTLHKQEKEAREAGKASFFLAWVMDEDQEERAHGVTIDVAQKYIETETKLVTLLDAPGHRDFIPKMISGASAADAAVLVIPAAVGEFESGFQANGQTKEHAMLAKALGVNQLLVVVNKLDVTDPPWSQDRYDAVKTEVAPFLARAGYRPKKIRYVPASGLSGENVSKRDPDGALSSWYDGPTLLQAIDAFSPAPKATDKPFRMCVADVSSAGKGVSVSGRVVQGRVRSGDKVVVMPLEDLATASRLERNGAPARAARAGDNAEVVLSGVDAARVLVGNVVCKAGGTLPAVRRFNAQIIALPALEVPVIKGTEFQLHMHNLDVMVHCSKLVSLTNSAGTLLKAKPRCVASGSTAHIRITCKRPICLEKYGDCRALGRFVLRQKGATVAFGLVLDTLPT